MEAPVIDLEKVLSSKTYIGEKSLISFGSPRQYVEPFVEKFIKANIPVTFRVAVSDRVANRDNDSEQVNAAYGRVLVEAKLPPQYTIHSHDSVIGMIYSLDTAKPIMRVYSGENAWACTNLAIFGARYVHQVDIMSGVGSTYEKALEYLDGTTAQLARFQTIYEAMNDKFYSHEEIDRILGHILRESYKNKAIGTNPVLSALKDLDDPKSKYAIIDGRTTQWNIYSALTQYVTDKVDILEKAQKTVMLSNLFVRDI